MGIMEVADTEVLTDVGWLPFSEVEGHKVLTFDDNKVVWITPKVTVVDADEWIYDVPDLSVKGTAECMMLTTNGRCRLGDLIETSVSCLPPYINKKRFNYEFVTSKKTVQYTPFVKLIGWILFGGELSICQPEDEPQFECIHLKFQYDADIDLLDSLGVSYNLRITRDPKFDHVLITDQTWIDEIREVCYKNGRKSVPDFILKEGGQSAGLFHHNFTQVPLKRYLIDQLQWASLFGRFYVTIHNDGKEYYLSHEVHIGLSTFRPKRVQYTGKLYAIEGSYVTRRHNRMRIA